MLAEEGRGGGVGGEDEESGENGRSGKRALERVVVMMAVEEESEEEEVVKIRSGTESEPEPKKMSVGSVRSVGEEGGRGDDEGGREDDEGGKDEEVGEPNEGSMVSGESGSLFEAQADEEEEEEEKRASSEKYNGHGSNERVTEKQRERSAKNERKRLDGKVVARLDGKKNKNKTTNKNSRKENQKRKKKMEVQATEEIKKCDEERHPHPFSTLVLLHLFPSHMPLSVFHLSYLAPGVCTPPGCVQCRCQRGRGRCHYLIC